MMRWSGRARLDEKGRLVLPAEYRRRLGLKPGDEVAITEEEGVLRVESRKTAARSLIGVAGATGSRSTLEDLRELRQRQLESEDKALQSFSPPGDVGATP
jgi:AbrB family looped-hinge helix DNA binding protein